MRKPRVRSQKDNHVILTDMGDNLAHGICVSNLSCLIARELGFEQEFIDDLAIAGLLHDIGKLQLSGYLYGRLDVDAEGRELSYTKSNRGSAHFMRMHSKLSYDILKEAGYNNRILQIVLHHHENYDGSGYPKNLSGEDIPIGARMMRVADTFTALTSERPYRHAFDADTAIEIMIDEIEFYDMKFFLMLQRLVHEDEVLAMVEKCKEPFFITKKTLK